MKAANNKSLQINKDKKIITTNRTHLSMESLMKLNLIFFNIAHTFFVKLIINCAGPYFLVIKQNKKRNGDKIAQRKLTEKNEMKDKKV